MTLTADFCFSQPSQSSDLEIRETVTLCVAQNLVIQLRSSAYFISDFINQTDLIKEPWIDLGDVEYFFW